MIVQEAYFRLATRQETVKAKGDCLEQRLSSIWQGINYIQGTIDLLWKGADLLAWDTPPTLKAAHWITKQLGWAPHHDLFKETMNYRYENYKLIPMHTHQITNEVVMKAFFKEHRNDEIFTPNKSFKKLFEIVKKTFPETQFTEEDLILTCGKDSTKFYHKLFADPMKGDWMKEIINKEVQLAFKDWTARCANNRYINITEETRVLASRIISRVLFGQKQDDIRLCNSLNFISNFSVKEMTGKATAEDRIKFGKALNDLRIATGIIICSRHPIPLFGEKLETPPPQRKEDPDIVIETFPPEELEHFKEASKNIGDAESDIYRQRKDNGILSHAKMQAMIFTALFAGQETTAVLMGHIMAQLGINPEQVERLNQDSIMNIFTRSIHDFTPAFAVGRVARDNIVLEYKLEGENKFRNVFFPKDDILAGRIITIAEKTILPEEGKLPPYSKWKPFGGGLHRCPGENLAVNEVSALIEELKKGYKITMHPDVGELKKLGRITLQYDQDIIVHIEKIDN